MGGAVTLFSIAVELNASELDFGSPNYETPSIVVTDVSIDACRPMHACCSQMRLHMLTQILIKELF